MKKNILTIVVIALCVVNMVLTSVMLFVMFPAFSSMNKIITQVASILNLELESGENSYSIADLEVKSVTFDANGDTQTINLMPSGDGEAHFGIIKGVKFDLNTTAEDYKDVAGIVDNKSSILTGIVKEVISSFTIDTISEEAVKKQAMEKIADKLGGSSCIVDISLDGFMYQ